MWGKSTLTNRLVGEKVAIVSQSLRLPATGSAASSIGRIPSLFLMDTPGFHKPRTKLGDYMVNVTRQSVSDVDAVILMVEPIAHGAGRKRRC